MSGLYNCILLIILKCFILILGFNNHSLCIIYPKKLKRSNLKRDVQIPLKHIIISSVCFKKKGSFFLLTMKYYIWKEKILCCKISVAPKIICIFRFFLEWLKLCSSSVLLIIVLIIVLVMECLQTVTQRPLDLNACK